MTPESWLKVQHISGQESVLSTKKSTCRWLFGAESAMYYSNIANVPLQTKYPYQYLFCRGCVSGPNEDTCRKHWAQKRTNVTVMVYISQ